MELAIYFSELERLLAIDEALRPIDPDKIINSIDTVLFGDDVSNKEYYGNLISLKWLDLITREGLEFSRLYFGQEFCEHLIPAADEVEQAYFFARQLGWEFSYVTGYVTAAGLQKTRENLACLAGHGHVGEVVVNDWGVLRMLRREFPRMQPILGRLLSKQKRLARFNTPTTPPPVFMAGIEASEESIRRNQIGAYRDISLANPVFRAFLRAQGIVGADLDIVPAGVRAPEQGWGMPLGFYFPWGYVAGGRNCPTAGVVEPRRAHVAVDGACPRFCRRFNLSRPLAHYPEMTLQRGNALFVFHGEYASPWFDGNVSYDRLIFQPYIPL
jgi:hypothetical protein